MKSYLLIVIGFIGILTISGCAMQQDMVYLDDRISMMEQRLSNIERANTETAKKLEPIDAFLKTYGQSLKDEDQALRDQAAELRAALTHIREDIQILTGNIEETRYLVDSKIKSLDQSEEKMGDRFNRLEKDKGLIQDKIRRIEEYLNLEPLKPTEVSEKQESAPEALSETDAYTKAKQALDKGNLEAAREGFSQFLLRYPKSAQADNAQFWIGEVYYREKWYEKAILEYQKVIEKYPQGNKVPSALLKQGLSFFNLGDKANSRLILKELVKKYPTSSEAKIAEKKLPELN